MIIKKLFFITAITFTTVNTLLPTEQPPQEQQSTTQYIQATFTNILLSLTTAIQKTFDYIKSFFQQTTPDTTSKPILEPGPGITVAPGIIIVSDSPPKNELPVKQEEAQIYPAPVREEIPPTIPTNMLDVAESVDQEPQSADQAFALVVKDLTIIKHNQIETTGELIDEIDSPVIQKEKAEKARKPLMNLVQHVKELDMIIAQLPATEWPLWQAKQAALLTPATPALKNAIQQSIKNSWKEHGTTIVPLALQATSMGMIGALITFTMQYAKMATGNLETLDTNALLLSFLTYASASLIEKSNTLLTTNTALQSTVSAAETNILYQAILAPSVPSKTYQFKMPLFKGVINYLIINEAYEVLSKMLEQNGEITKTIKNMDAKEFLFGKKRTQTTNPVVSLTLPKIKAAIGNQQLALALTEVGWIFFQSATLGGLFWTSGLGYANTTAVESVSNAVLTGMAQGILANVAALANDTTPGAILSLSTVSLSQKMVALTGVNIATTPQAAVTGVLQTLGTEVTNFLIDESEKTGGFLEALQKGRDALGAAISSRWLNAWVSVSEAWETIQEIEPLPI